MCLSFSVSRRASGEGYESALSSSKGFIETGMNTSESELNVSLTLAQHRRLNAICNAYRSDWAIDRRSDITHYLAELPHLRTVLLYELVQLDIEMACSSGITVHIADYLRHFPNDGSIIERAFETAAFKVAEHKSDTDDAGQAGTSERAEPAFATPGSPSPAAGADTLSAFVHDCIGDDYHLDRIIGHGAMGVVYRARDARLERFVAIKVIRPTADRDRFLREAKLLAKVHSPNVITVFDFRVLNDGCPMIVMEWIDGGNLEHAATTETSEAIVVNWMQQTCAGMLAAHEQGIVHRDLKPSNILVNRSNCIKVADFGLARAIAATSADWSLTHHMVGTPWYMAPEQADRPSRVDQRADIYSFGATFYHVLTRRPPFVADDRLAVILKHKTEPLVSPQSLRPDLSDDTSEVIERCLAKSPADRFQSFSEVLLSLDSFGASGENADDRDEVEALMSAFFRNRSRHLDGQSLQYLLRNGCEIRIMQGDVTAQAVDAIVSLDSSLLKMHSEVARKICRYAGTHVMRELHKLAPVRPGRVVVTSAGELGAKWLFHGVTTGLVSGCLVRPSRALIAQIIDSCIYHADTHDVRSLALPLIGLESRNLPRDVCLKVVFETLVRRLTRTPCCLRDIRILLATDCGDMERH